MRLVLVGAVRQEKKITRERREGGFGRMEGVGGVGWVEGGLRVIELSVRVFTPEQSDQESKSYPLLIPQPPTPQPSTLNPKP